jgi:hypothetical protein
MSIKKKINIQKYKCYKQNSMLLTIAIILPLRVVLLLVKKARETKTLRRREKTNDMAKYLETCYMYITCTSFVYQFFKLIIESVGLTCESLWVLQIQ